jgi:uncharacterized protein (UPF0332 family)
MNADERQDLVNHRITKAKDTLNEVEVLVQNSFLNNAVNRIYYACFYAVSALFIDRNINAKSHSGTKQMFGLHFVKTGLVSKEASDFYTIIFEQRHTGDYDDYVVFERNKVITFLEQAKNFISEIEVILLKHK